MWGWYGLRPTSHGIMVSKWCKWRKLERNFNEISSWSIAHNLLMHFGRRLNWPCYSCYGDKFRFCDLIGPTDHRIASPSTIRIFPNDQQSVKKRILKTFLRRGGGISFSSRDSLKEYDNLDNGNGKLTNQFQSEETKFIATKIKFLSRNYFSSSLGQPNYFDSRFTDLPPLLVLLHSHRLIIPG